MKTAILLDNTAFSDKNYVFMSEGNRHIDIGTNITLITVNITPKMIDYHGAVMNISEVINFSNGLIIATDLNTALTLERCPTNSKKLFYIYSIDWLNKPINFNAVYNILHNITVFVRSELHQKYLKTMYNKDSYIVEPKLEHIWNSLEKIR